MRNLLIGQWISALIAGTGIFSSLLTNLHANFPIFLCFINYTLLSFFVLRKSVVSQFCPNAYADGERKVTMFEMLTRTIDDVNVPTTITATTERTDTDETPQLDNLERNPLAAVEGNVSSFDPLSTPLPRISYKYCYRLLNLPTTKRKRRGS